MKTVEIIVHGKVQGVFFRKNTKDKAGETGVTGTVRNKTDGTVEVIATGNADAIDKLLDWCRQGDPPAEVEHVEVQEKPLQPFTDFTVLR